MNKIKIRKATANDLDSLYIFEQELIKYDNIVELLNKPRLQVKKGFFNNKIILLPILFVFGFIILAILRKIYLKAKKLNLSKI